MVEDRLLRLGNLYQERKERRAQDFYGAMFKPSLQSSKSAKKRGKGDEYWKGKTLKLIKGEQSALQTGLKRILFPEYDVAESTHKKSLQIKKPKSTTFESYNVFEAGGSIRYSNKKELNIASLEDATTRNLSFGNSQLNQVYKFNL